jgi:hypothetical protein
VDHSPICPSDNRLKIVASHLLSSFRSHVHQQQLACFRERFLQRPHYNLQACC